MSNKRNIIGNKVHDPSVVAGLQYNEKAGAQKQVDVGPALLPLKSVSAGVLTYTTNATAEKTLDSMGKNLAIYNNGAIASITMAKADGITLVSLAVGVTDANGRVGIPLMPNAWTYLSCGDNTRIIASNASALVFVIDDDTQIGPNR